MQVFYLIFINVVLVLQLQYMILELKAYYLF